MSAEKEKAARLEKEAYNEVFDEKGGYIGYPIYQLNISWEDVGHPASWSEATATYVIADGLCETCSQYDFKELLEERESEEQSSMHLGTIDELVRKDECSFCKFLVMVAMFCYRNSGAPSDAVCSLQRDSGSYSKHPILHVDCDVATLNDGVTRHSTRRALSLWRDNPVPADGDETRIRADGSPIPPFPPLLMMARLLSSCVDMHSKCRQQAQLGIAMTTQMFVIDLEIFKIVPVPKICEYAALSYVWGTQTANKYRINPVEFSTDEAVEFPEEIALTIMHAMNVAKSLGFRYFWVDQLCIPRDCREQQIAEMDKIYRNAILTIVAAVQDAESGLPGVGAMDRKRFAPPVVKIRDVNVGVRVPSYPLQALEDTTWETRGWTYQEKVLSSRQLIFTEDDVYYICLEGSKGDHECHQSNEVKFTRETFVESGGVLAWAHGRVSFQIYGDCVDVYSKRNLTYPSDILHGFAGLISFLRDRYDWKFCWGLPDDNFKLALIWMSESTTRREARDAQGRQFPSWSWAGWMGRVSHNGIRPKLLAQAKDLYGDFVGATWDTDMLEKASETGILVLDVDCMEITGENAVFFQNHKHGEQFQQFERNQAQPGNIFTAITLLADKDAYVRGLLIHQDGDEAYRVGTAGITLEKWLALPRERRRVHLA